MKITFYAHASFRLEGDGLSIVTDPYTPGPDASQFDPIDEPADIVVMSSATDRFHSDPSHILGDPVVVNAVEVPDEGVDVIGLHIDAYQTWESYTHDYGERDAEANALYAFTLDGIRVLHIGDLGNAFSPEHLDALAGRVDVLFALTGDQPTIELDDLETAIATIQPRVVIPMHYYSAKGVLKILPVEEFTKRYPADQVTFVGDTTLTLNADSLPESMHIYVLEQSR